MLPADRRRHILTLLAAQGSVSIKELCAQFNVSHMTIHRDLDYLESEGQLRKVRGGALEATPVPAVAATSAVTHCCVCERPVQGHTAVICHSTSGEKNTACCPHCMLMYLSHRTPDEMPATILVTDFLYSIKVNAQAAHYLLGPDIVVCCTPSALAFSRLEDAERFQRGFGGRLMSFPEALQHVRKGTLLNGEHLPS
jgi:hypothetical protein